MLDSILSRTRTAEFRQYLTDLLVALCNIDTTPNPDVSVMRCAEDACFRIIERELKTSSFLHEAFCERVPIRPEIEKHAAFSKLHFTKTPERPEGMSPGETYEGRGNLVFSIPGCGGESGESLALNAHIDVVAPFVPPAVGEKVVTGRGTCDDKGSCVAIVAALKILSEVFAEKQMRLNKNLTAMFVIEEETGGNGSLSLAVDRELKKQYDSIVVLECTDQNIHPANRGSVWYKAELSGSNLSLLEMAAFVIEELEKEGRAIRAESTHPLFTQRPVHTCHGMIGPFGEHPSRICGEVAFKIAFEKEPSGAINGLTRDVITEALEHYVEQYGDKTRVIDSSTGNPKVASHHDLTRDGRDIHVDVHGASGHMGSISENDGAITKMAFLVRNLVFSRAKIEKAAGAPFHLELIGHPDAASLVLEGGQGFVPTHGIDEVMARMRAASERGVASFLQLAEADASPADCISVTYDKLHNDAFEGDPESGAMKNAVQCAKDTGLWRDQAIEGWSVSCDARLFAGEYPDMPVITTGPGKLAHAHADEEQLDIDELRKSVEWLVWFILVQTGTVEARTEGSITTS